MTINRKIEKYKVDHSNFGGLIYPFDFDIEYNQSKHIADRIISDIKFDEMFRRKAEFNKEIAKEDNVC